MNIYRHHLIPRATMRIGLILSALIFTITTGFAQTLERVRPPISAYDALDLAGKYVIENRIDVSKHFVSAVRYMESGSWTDSSIGKGAYWQVTYELVQHADGGQQYILIYMDGKIGHIGGL
jgi:hypothetical protein